MRDTRGERGAGWAQLSNREEKTYREESSTANHVGGTVMHRHKAPVEMVVDKEAERALVLIVQTDMDRMTYLGYKLGRVDVTQARVLGSIQGRSFWGSEGMHRACQLPKQRTWRTHYTGVKIPGPLKSPKKALL